MSLIESRHAYKKPGMTLAESLGIVVPDNAPGGQPLNVTSTTDGYYRASERGRRAVALREAGFYDTDAYRKADQQ